MQNELETNLMIYIDPAQARDQQSLENAVNEIETIIDEEGRFLDLLGNFENFQFEQTKSFTFDLLRTIIHLRWNEIEQNFDNVYYFLFVLTTQPQIYQKLTVAEKLAETQAFFMARAFPTLIQDLLQPFNDLQKNIRPIIQYRFIKMFSYNIAYPKPPVIFHEKLYVDYIKPFFEILFSFTSGVNTALEALSYLVKWASIYNWYDEERYFQILMECFNKNGLRSLVADVISSLLCSVDGITDRFNLVDEIQKELERYEAEQEAKEKDPHIIFAKLAASAGSSIISDPQCEPYFVLALSFLRSSKNESHAREISNFVLDFISDFVENFPDHAPSVIETVCLRLGNRFGSEKFTIDDNLNRYCSLAFTCLKSSQVAASNTTPEGAEPENSSLKTLFSILELDISENTNLVSAALLVIYQCSQMGFAFNGLTEIIPQLLEKTGELDPSFMAFHFSVYRIIFICSEEELGSEFINEVFNRLAVIISTTLSESEEDDIDMRKRFVTVLLDFVKKFAKSINIQTLYETVTTLPTNIPNVSSIYSYMFDLLDVDAQNQLLNYLVEEMTKNECFQNLFNFLSKILCPNDESFKQELSSFIIQAINDHSGDKDLLPSIIQSISCLSIDGFQILVSLVENYQENALIISSILYSFNVIRKTLPKYAKIASKPELNGLLDNEQFIEFNNTLFNEYFNILDKYWSAPQSQSMKSVILGMIINGTNLFKTTIRQFISDDAKTDLLQMEADVLSHYYDNPHIFTTIVQFARESCESFPIDVLKYFIRPSMNFLYSQNFTINSPKWDNVVKNVILLHMALYNKLPDDFLPLFREASLDAYKAPEEAVESYIQQLVKLKASPTDKDSLEEARLFFADLAVGF
ncbi:hypothetical protein TVAG_476720 [Trichomonas vaginalis G3]|uniref:Uncharacterized protein n=1 Tax=Trichomonas vaginalis (strain ATCC PRA-98 / G3) TaxID=412133 RepID=A2DA95_TRIV3|nr:armadillo (ARM) repeat-containing protein family [Trichomonas vaginalis G3]EAY22743.1 hypothetical protein TVAG_476720 [Trichomonas vaginalis G3]KAI5525554.1 armadillo (ARM) repeat-containing protein family [Trichomonas vaginalis G3]|eukprot:XP_001583729.1 hypothetical protein [Trichomonas vaginalis G3]